MSVIEAEFGTTTEDTFDHRLPLVLLRERRRELVMQMGSGAPALSKALIQEIAAIQ